MATNNRVKTSKSNDTFQSSLKINLDNPPFLNHWHQDSPPRFDNIVTDSPVRGQAWGDTGGKVT